MAITVNPVHNDSAFGEEASRRIAVGLQRAALAGTHLLDFLEQKYHLLSCRPAWFREHSAECERAEMLSPNATLPPPVIDTALIAKEVVGRGVSAYKVHGWGRSTLQKAPFPPFDSVPFTFSVLLCFYVLGPLPLKPSSC